MNKENDKDLFVQKILTTIWEIPPNARKDLKIQTNFLLKWHADYLRDKIHLELDRNTKICAFRPYLYRDETKFYIISYDGCQLEDSKFFWLSFRKAAHQSNGYVLIKKAKAPTNNDLLYTGITRS